MLDPPEGYELVQLEVVRLPEASVSARIRPGTGTIDAAWLRTIDDNGHELARVPLSPTARLGPVTAGPQGVDTGGGGSLGIGAEPEWVAIGVSVERPSGKHESVEVRWTVRAREGQLDIVGPGLGFRFYEFPDTTAWLQEDVSNRMTASVDGVAPADPVRRIGPRS
jgi:hypothetical protein